MGVQQTVEQGAVGAVDLRAELLRLEADVIRLREKMAPAKPPVASQITPARLRSLIKARRARETILGDKLFADPAWDMLLEAFWAELMQRRVSVSGLCRGAAVPATTALRWIQKLEQEDWLARRDDPVDARRNWIELTPEGSARLALYFRTVATDLML
jgi:DNA-binding MarR family transcriptional regulator